MSEYSFESISDFSFLGDGHYKVSDGQVMHQIYIKKSIKNSPFLYVFGQGAVDKSKPQPNFQRISWVEDLDDSVIICSDPTIVNNKLTIGWCQCSKDVNYFYRLAELLKLVRSKIFLKIDKTIFFGSSAGGFSSLMLSAYFQDSVVVVNNPQIDWTNFYQKKVSEVLNEIYEGISIEEYRNRYPSKYSPIALFQKTTKLPSIIYMQNKSDDFHFKNHYLPFVEWVYDQKSMKNGNQYSEFITYLYDNPDEGHDPCSRKKTINYLNFAKSL